ncbi:gamma carbonic anhydrase 1 mitochondrial-like, partial [Trifolium medium]|nr:gamma carbonic anhydrase 1 mitochondrial-like [Trifolium medium]
VWAGNPAKFLRKLTAEEISFISQSAINYSNLAQVHAAENAKPFDEIEFEKALRKKFARKDEEYDSMLGVVREIPPELILPDNVLPDKQTKESSLKDRVCGSLVFDVSNACDVGTVPSDFTTMKSQSATHMLEDRVMREA